jgi:hypothetical protein
MERPSRRIRRTPVRTIPGWSPATKIVSNSGSGRRGGDRLGPTEPNLSSSQVRGLSEARGVLPSLGGPTGHLARQPISFAHKDRCMRFKGGFKNVYNNGRCNASNRRHQAMQMHQQVSRNYSPPANLWSS